MICHIPSRKKGLYRYMTGDGVDTSTCMQVARSTTKPRRSKQAHGRSVAEVNKTTLKVLLMLLPMP